MPLFYVKIRKNIDICNYLPIYYPAICRGWGTFSVPSQGAGVPLAAPPHALPKGREFLPAVFEVVVWRSFPLGKVRMGLAGAPSPWEGTEKLPLFPFYRRGQASLSGVYEAFCLRCVVRVKSKNRPREGLGTLPNGFLGDVLAVM